MIIGRKTVAFYIAGVVLCFIGSLLMEYGYTVLSLVPSVAAIVCALKAMKTFGTENDT